MKKQARYFGGIYGFSMKGLRRPLQKTCGRKPDMDEAVF